LKAGPMHYHLILICFGEDGVRPTPRSDLLERS
jgi:hypothetical protein